MIGSVDKAIQILNCFSQEEPVLGVGEISRLTGFTPSTVSRILSTLEAHAVVEKTEGYGRYQFGCRIYLWGLINKIQNSLVTSARPVMAQLRDETGEEVSLYVVTGNHRTRIERVESRHAIAMVGRVGGRLPLHTGASGQMLLAYMGEAERRVLLENVTLKGYTPKTITDPVALEARLETIRHQGFAVSMEEREPGAFSVVAPVRQAGNQVIASLCVCGPLYRLDRGQLDAIIKTTMAAGARISEKMGYRPGQGSCAASTSREKATKAKPEP